MTKQTITNMKTKFGNPAKKQIIISEHEGEKRTFVSYNTVIAIDINGFVTLDSNYWNYSATTNYYRNQFLNENLNDTRKKIGAGLYKLDNLNK